ncbi:ankyrin repeat domain-containing protein, partial [bacterium]
DLFHAAILGDAEHVLKALKNDPSIVALRDENGWSVADYAFRSGLGKDDPKAAEALRAIALELIEAGADTTGALDQAVYKNDFPLVEILLAKGARIQDGDTLNHAACDGSFAALDLVAKAGVDLNLTAGTEHHGGYTPFGCTLTLRSLKGAQWFLDQGIDPNYVGGPNGESSLHVAVRSGAAVPLIQLLLDRGADPSVRDGSGMTPLQAAEAKGNKKVVDFLKGI